MAVCCDIKYMNMALELAAEAKKHAEVPVGAVIVHKDKVIATGRNRRESNKDALAHAEIEAIAKACKVLDRWRLSDCTLYVTLEPCPMCMGAVINARIDRVVFGAYDYKAGACGSVMDLTKFGLNHKVDVEGGILKEECVCILKSFFQNLRETK